MKTIGVFTILLLLPGAGSVPRARAAEGTPTATGKTGSSAPADNVVVKPAAGAVAPETVKEGMDWAELSRASFRFLGVQHAFRLATEPDTRKRLKGPFPRNYGRAVSNLHGWGDGDDFYINYVGHPMEGAVAGFLWVQNDAAYRRVEFGSAPGYWKGRLRAAGFAWAYSAQFEIGPLSEASIGGVQSHGRQQGFADHVITPSIGMAWMIGEDAMDRYVIKRIEAATTNPYVRMLIRSGLNPSRAFANILQGRVPWRRETRSGAFTYVASDEQAFSPRRRAPAQPADVREFTVAPPFEFAVTFQPNLFWGNQNSTGCLGGGATAGFRVASSWQVIADVGGCKMTGLEKDLSGDSLTYLAGPRWVGRIGGPWSAYVQFLAGGGKITQERMYPELKQRLEKAAVREKKPPPSHEDYTEGIESNGFVLAPGGGLSYNLNPALTVRVAELSYRHAWTAPLWGREYARGMQWSSGLVLRMGTW